MKSFSLDGKTCLVSGGSRGIGADATITLAEAGAYITGRHIIVDGGLLADRFPRMQF